MNQSNIIAAYLFFAFVIFITMRGELRTYLGFFLGGGSSPVAPGSASASGGDSNTGLASGITSAIVSATTGVPIDTSSLFTRRQ